MQAISANKYLVDCSNEFSRARFIEGVLTKKEGRQIVTVTKWSRKRSLPQNSYYHGVVVPIILEALREHGYREFTDADVHEHLKDECLKKSIPNEVTGEYITVTGSTAELTTVQFQEYIERVAQYASTKLGCIIPSPNA
jgi:hypothetical protein